MRKHLFSKLFILTLILSMLFSFIGCTSEDTGLLSDIPDVPEDVVTCEEEFAAESASASQEASVSLPPQEVSDDDDTLAEDGWYYSPDDVALYLYTYGCLPENFITKDEARNLGWESSEGNLWDVADGMCIGGDVFANREGLLPDAPGRAYYECDVDFDGGFRGGERIVFSNDGLIYYTDDHYESFTLLYE